MIRPPYALVGVLVVSMPAQEIDFSRLVDDSVGRVLDAGLDKAGTEQAVEELSRLGSVAGTTLVEQWLAWLDRFAATEVQALDPSVLAPGVSAVLYGMGPAAEPALRALIVEARRRRWATFPAVVVVLRDCGPWHRDLRDELAAVAAVKVDDLAGDPPRMATLELGSALDWLKGRLMIDPSESVEELADRLLGCKAPEIEFAARLLRARGPEAKAAVPALFYLLDEDAVVWTGFVAGDDAVGVYRSLVDALIAIAPDDPRVIRAYSFCLFRSSRRSSEEQLALVRAIAEFGSAAADVLDALLHHDEDHEEVTLEVVRLLGQLATSERGAEIRTQRVDAYLERIAQSYTWNPELVAAAKAALEKIR